MNLLTAENIEKSYGERQLFHQITFGINDGERIGLIGINGTGKSTLLKILAGAEESDAGMVTYRSGLRIAYLSQNPVFEPEETILQYVTKGQQAEEAYRNIEGEAVAMLQKLGITNVQGKPELLSGGQKKRVALARTLLLPSDFLILDEPTNHLDSDMTEWLEDVLNRYTGSLLMVTHDRYFLDEVTTRIFELDRGELYSYEANYSKFVEMKAEREAMVAATERKASSLFRSELAWMQRGARARSTKQKAHIQRFEALRDRDKIETDGTVEIQSAYTRLGKKTAELSEISKAYGEHVLIKDFSYIFLQKERVGIVGRNGCGKTTLLRILTGKVQPDSGNIDIGVTVKIGYFSQENEALDENKRVIDYIRDTAEFIPTKDGVITASQMCEKFLFDGDLQYSQIAKLSGGEKRRLYLLKILMEAPNLLILDEPTNDLDIQTLTVLEDYLQSFEGIVVAVSHDRYFLDKLAGRILAFVENGVIKQYEGNYTDYRNVVLNEDVSGTQNDATGSKNSNQLTSTESVSKSTWKKPDNRIKFSYQEKKDYETIDADISELEDKI
ncbi:MAG TPA: ABC-F family ATP-binding cassette domain-containing protein, partial [Lachnospiraceae bacterium]|nr:ABC-F family ATP-binding cassette domain-containing protein [Lachnospiraceae bacterium]